MPNLQHLRETIGSHLGSVLTPEAAADIERAAFWSPDVSIDPAQFGSVEFKGYTIRAERLRDVLPELLELHELHWLETERYRHGLKLDPDYSAMLADERAGNLLQFVARDASGNVAAHLRVYLLTSRHTQTGIAQEDTLFLREEHRPGAFLVIQVMRFAERAILSLNRGTREIRVDSKLVNNASVLMRRIGYEPCAIQHVKFFEDTRHVQ